MHRTQTQLASMATGCALALGIFWGTGTAAVPPLLLEEPGTGYHLGSFWLQEPLEARRSAQVDTPTKVTFDRPLPKETAGPRSISRRLKPARTLSSLPLRFEPAPAGQHYRYFMRGAGYQAFFAPAEIVISPSDRGEEASSETGARVQPLRLRFAGGDRDAAIRGAQPLPGKSNYFLGNDPKRWRTNVPTFARVRVDGLYPGVDLEYYERQGDLEVDLVVAPGTDPDSIRLEIDGASAAALNADGDLVLQSGSGLFHLARPHVYQRVEGDERPVQGRYVLHREPGVAGGSQPAGETQGLRVGFELAQYDRALPLVIDPVLAYARRVGGSLLDQGTDIAADSAGNVYVTGHADSLDFPGVGGGDPELLGTGGNGDAFIIKLGPDGTLLFSTFLGGDRADSGVGIDIDDDGNIYVAGSTSWLGSGFPTTPGAYRRAAADFFISKLDPTGSTLLYSTFLGYLNTGTIRGIATPSCGGNACIAVTGASVSGHPITANAWAQSVAEADGTTFVSVLDPSQVGIGPQLIYSTYFAGGTGLDVADGPNGTVYILGDRPVSNKAFPLKHAFDTVAEGNREAFVSVFDPSLSGADSLIYSTFLGGSRTENGTVGDGAIDVDANGVALVTGTTGSLDFPVTPEGQRVSREALDAFLVAIDPSRPGRDSLRYGTYVGGTSNESGTGVAAGAPGIAYVTGTTSSVDLPDGSGGTAPRFGPANAPGVGTDSYITKIDWTRIGEASLVDAAYIAGNGIDVAYAVAADGFGAAAVAGYTSSALGFDPEPGTGTSDVMVAGIDTVIVLPDGTVGTDTSEFLETGFGTPPYIWAVVADAPPAGLQLAGDGELAGIPEETGTSTFTARITDALGAMKEQTYRKRIGTGADNGDVLIRKAGVPVFQGETQSWFILLRNRTDHTLYNVRVFEALQGWFEFVGSNPPPTVLEPRPTGNVHWTLPEMAPGELKLITYRTRLPVDFAVGTEVQGEACLTDEDCNEEKAECLKDGKTRCDNQSCGWFNNNVHCLECNTMEEEQCRQEWLTCRGLVGMGSSESLEEGASGGGCATKHDRTLGRPLDPNDKSVASGLYIPSGEIIGYAIHFENIGTADARNVFVTDVLDGNLDLATVQIARPFGGLVPLPPDTTVSILDDDDEHWNVTLDSASRTITWELFNINLPPEQNSDVFFAVQAPTGLPSGTEIRNQATIQFEDFEEITTSETLNIIDDIAPVCSVDPLPATTTFPVLDVSWGGEDLVGEIELYVLYVSTNGGPFLQLALSDTPGTKAFTGEVGSTYGFLCLARDTAGNVEAFEAVAETSTTVEEAVENEPPVADAGADMTGTSGVAVVLNGGDSNDPDNGPDPLTYSWRFVSVPAGSALTDIDISGANTASPSFKPDVAGMYTLELTASDGDLDDSATTTVTVDSEPPGAVDDLAARARTTDVTLTWTSVAGATSYDIYRAQTSGGLYTRIASGHVSSYALYMDSGLTSGVTYYYVIRALGPHGEESGDSNQASATPAVRIRRSR